MAKRIVLLVVGMLLFLAPTGFGHGFSVVARVSFQAPDQITVKLVDPALKPVGGATVTAAVQPGGRPMTLAEGPEGTYTAQFRGLASGEVEFAVEATVEGQTHTARISLATDGSQPEVTRAMSEPQAGGPVAEPAPPEAESEAVTWRLFVGIAAMGGAAAMSAWLRRRRA